MVKIYNFYENDPKYYYIVLEFIAGGELFDRIVQKVGRWVDGSLLRLYFLFFVFS